MKKTVKIVLVLFLMLIIIATSFIVKNYITTYIKKGSSNLVHSEANLISAPESKDIYDVILFWGQSNMLGTCGRYTYERSYQDPRYTGDNPEYTIEEFSNISGIEQEFLSNSEKMNYVKVYPEKDTIFEYKYSDNTLIDLYSEPETLGETLAYDETTGRLVLTNATYYALQQSHGTNIIPQFCKTYYEKTGRKVVAVLAANGGEKIQNFLPATDEENTDPYNQMIFEGMVTKYKSAISYMEKRGMTIQNKVWVCMQGESDVENSKMTSSSYQKYFEKVDSNLRKELEITKGVIIETAHTISDKYWTSDGNGGWIENINESFYSGVQRIHEAQEAIANANDHIIIGSKYAYERYIPRTSIYISEEYQNVINEIFKHVNSWEEAYSIASASVCITPYQGGITYQNSIHFTSAALCQIGKEAAEELAKELDKTSPVLEVSYSTTKPTNGDVIVTIKANEKIQGRRIRMGVIRR